MSLQYNDSISFGAGCRAKILEKLGNKSVLVCCSETARERFSTDKILGTLFQSNRLLFATKFSVNPTISDLQTISREAADFHIDAVLGLGGGSARDVAKVSSAAIPALRRGITLRELLAKPSTIDTLPVLQVYQACTTAGTGSEVTPFATIWDIEECKKTSIQHPLLFATEAFIDPDFLKSIPVDIAITTALDALNQAFESLWNKNATTSSRRNAIQSATLSLGTLPKLQDLHRCAATRSNLSMASMLAGLAISETRTSICHAISYPVTLKFNVPHGLACAFSMKAVYRFNEAEIASSLNAIENKLGTSPYLRLCEIFEYLNVRDYLKKYFSSPKAAIPILELINNTERLENNIINCSPDDLKVIIQGSLSDIFN